MNTTRGPSLGRPLTHVLSLFIPPTLVVWAAGDRDAWATLEMEGTHRDE
jgi:hypothetical protein